MTHHHKHALLAHPGPGKTTTTTKAAVASGDKDHNVQLVSAEDIRLCAYRKWESAGKPTGDGIQFWLEAQQELVQGK
jgi:signal recognition particle GTPase